MKSLKTLFVTFWMLVALGAFAVFGIGEDDSKIEETKASDKTAEECEIPAFAKAIGHEDLWLKHNGCPPRETKQKDDEK